MSYKSTQTHAQGDLTRLGLKLLNCMIFFLLLFLEGVQLVDQLLLFQADQPYQLVQCDHLLFRQMFVLFGKVYFVTFVSRYFESPLEPA